MLDDRRARDPNRNEEGFITNTFNIFFVGINRHKPLLNKLISLN